MRACVYRSDSSKRDTHALTMSFSHMNITAHKRGKRNGLRRGKGSIPSCPVFDARYLLAVFVLVGPRGLMFDELRSVLRMLTIAQVCEVFCIDSAVEIPVFGKRTTPFAVCLSIFALTSNFAALRRTRASGRSAPVLLKELLRLSASQRLLRKSRSISQMPCCLA